MKALFCLFAALLLLTRCTDRETRHESDLLEAAGRLMQEQPDSASRLLAEIHRPEEMDDRHLAHWCMLCGKATGFAHADTIPAYLWERTVKWMERNGKPEERALAMLYLGRAYAEDGKYDKAMEIYMETLDFAQKHRENNTAGYICTYMADLYSSGNAPNEAIKKRTEATTFFTKAKNYKSQAYALKNLAMEYAFADSFVCAENVMKQADSIARMLNIQRLNYSMANAYANIYNLEGRHDLSEKYFKKAISLDTKDGIQDSFGLTYSYLAAGKLTQAKELAGRLAMHDSADFRLNDIYAIIYKAEGDYKRALHFREICYKTLDSLASNQYASNMSKTKHWNGKNQIRKENKELKVIRHRLLFGLFICLGFLISGRTFFIYFKRHTNIKMQLQKEQLIALDNERAEIAAQLTDIKYKLETAQRNKDEITDLQRQFTLLSERYRQLQEQRLKSSAIYKKLISLFKKKQPGNNKPLLVEKYWKQLAAEICKTYPDFRLALFERCPNLSEEEWKYCCLHILGFDGNDEAILLGIMPSSVWMKRSRIKQKLGFSEQKERSLHDILVKNFLS